MEVRGPNTPCPNDAAPVTSTRRTSSCDYSKAFSFPTRRPAVSEFHTTRNLTADVCVVGAGFAGLSAALRLKQAGASVIVLEARGQVGGRSSTSRLKDGGWVDWGGQWVGSSQDRFYSLIAEMECPTYPC